MDSWDSTCRLSETLQKALIAHKWPSPRNVFAAFDTEQEAYDLALSLASGSDFSDIMARLWAAQLFNWQGAGQARFKRSCRAIADTDQESRARIKRKFGDWKPTDIGPSSRVLGELCIQTHWRSRGKSDSRSGRESGSDGLRRLLVCW
jgi:hypothetical protein